VTRSKALLILIPFFLVAGVFALVTFLPKQYKVGERMANTVVFWNDKEAFIFLNANTTGQSSNILQDKIASHNYGFWTLLLMRTPGFYEQSTTAYHLLPSGELQTFPLPPKTAAYGSWSLHDGQLQLTPFDFVSNDQKGFRWDGEKFVSIPPQPKPQAQANSSSKLDPEDSADEDDESGGYLGGATRKLFKDAGWHTKQLTGYEGKGNQATLPIQLGESSFNLIVTSYPLNSYRTAQFDQLSVGAKSIELTGPGISSHQQSLWTQNGWRPISKKEYELRSLQSGRAADFPATVWIWLAIALSLVCWKLYAWFHLFFNLFTVKGRMLKNMATSYSFPPATLAQFPSLDTTALDRYTRELESMGFTRLLDFSLVSDKQSTVPNFCRLFASTRHHCFASVSQFFPRGKQPMPLKCSLECSLQDGWSIAFSDRKPQAASALIRRRKAIGVSMPDVSLSELFQAYIKMRDQVCMDLGVSPLKEDTLEAFTAKVQRSTVEMRDAVREKNFATGVPHFYFRKLSLLKSKPEHVWLGDYPKEAERRRQGYSYGTSPA
jgi:hypothetical protein